MLKHDREYVWTFRDANAYYPNKNNEIIFEEELPLFVGLAIPYRSLVCQCAPTLE